MNFQLDCGAKVLATILTIQKDFQANEILIKPSSSRIRTYVSPFSGKIRKKGRWRLRLASTSCPYLDSPHSSNVDTVVIFHRYLGRE